jgi:hypothetical protein
MRARLQRELEEMEQRMDEANDGPNQEMVYHALSYEINKQD